MRGVYQRAPALAVAVALSCGAPSGQSTATLSSPSPFGDVSPEILLRTRSYELPSSGRFTSVVLGTENGGRATRLVAVLGRSGERPRQLTPADVACRAVALGPRGRRAIAECRDSRSGYSGLRLVDLLAGTSVPLSPAAEATERWLAWSADGDTVWTASPPQASSPARLYATTRSRTRRATFAAPPGFAIAAYSPATDRALLHRKLHDEAHEVVLRDGRANASRLLLPTAADGRFVGLQLVDAGRAALLLADDGRDTPRLDRIDLDSGERTPFASTICPPVSFRAVVEGGAVVIVECAGRRHAVRIDAEGRELELPAVASESRIVDAMPGPGSGEWTLLTAGERWPAEIGIAAANGDFHPLTYGLAGRVRPAALSSPEPLRWTSGGIDLPAELWPALGSARGVVVWLGDGGRRASFGVHRPLLAALAAQGVATLSLRGRGDPAPSRRLRRAADGDPAAAAWADLRAARGATVGLAAAGVPRLLVAEGGWWAAAATALATTEDAPYDATLSLFPETDPLRAAFDALDAEEPRRTFLVARWGEPGAGLFARRREEWRFPVERSRRPLWLALDRRRADFRELAARVDSARAAGRPVDAFAADPTPESSRLSPELERALLERLLAVVADVRR